MFGDALIDIWYQSMIHVVFFSEVFNYLFTFISISVMINAFIMIVGDGYELSKNYEKHQWIHKPLPQPKNSYEKKIYLFLKIVQTDYEICQQEWENTKLERKEKKLGKKIAVSEEENFEQEQAMKSMEYHTRKIIELMKEIGDNYEDEKRNRTEENMDHQYTQL